MESARPATPTDLDGLAELWATGIRGLASTRGGAQLAAALGGAHVADRRAVLHQVLDDPDQLLISGLLDGAVFGVGVAHLARQADRLTAVVDGVYVADGAREVGVGEAIVDVVVDWATARGATGVDAPALPGDRAAKAFFETHGFVARLLVMHRELPGPGGP